MGKKDGTDMEDGINGNRSYRFAGNDHYGEWHLTMFIRLNNQNTGALISAKL